MDCEGAGRQVAHDFGITGHAPTGPRVSFFTLVPFHYYYCYFLIHFSSDFVHLTNSFFSLLRLQELSKDEY